MYQASRRSREVSPVSSQVMTRRTQASWVILAISASTLSLGAAGLAAGQGGGQLVQLPGGLGQRGAVEAAGLMLVQLRGVRQDRPAPGAVDDAAGVIGGQLTEPVLIDDGPGGRGHGEQVTAVTGGHRPHVVQVRARQQREVGLGVLPGVEDDGHLGAVLPGRGGQRGVPGSQRR